METLKLIALDTEDLAVVSAQLQDAVVRVEDMAYLKSQQRFALIANRFNWMAALKSDAGRTTQQQPFERRRTALRFERVTRVQLQAIDLNDKRRVLSMLTISFAAHGDTGPDGIIEIVFSGGASLRLEVECIEAELRDLGAAWATRTKPEHKIEPGVDEDA